MKIIKEMRAKDQAIKEMNEAINDQKTQNQLLKNENKKKGEAISQDQSFIKGLQGKLASFERQLEQHDQAYQ